MPSRITATFEVATPLFLGGADPSQVVELRAPSVKGALRFWWRALAWSRYGGDLIAIRSEESRLFGAATEDGAASSGAAGQASFLLRIPPIRGLKVIAKDALLQAGDGAIVGPGMRYFGYGLMGAFGTNAGRLVRPCLSAPFPFSIDLVSRDPLDPSVIAALKLTGLLGGLGARSRRGYGSLSLAALTGDVETWTPLKTRTEYASRLRAIVCPDALTGAEPKYSAFSGLSRVVVVAEGNEPLALLDEVGRKMQRYRSWGHNGKVNGEDSERNFQDDHDWSKQLENYPTNYPRRSMFGLPHNYSKMRGIVSQNSDRRASPFLVHIHRLSSGHCIAVLSVLRANFLEEGDRIWIWEGRPERPNNDPKRISADQLRTSRPDWTVLDGFIDGTNRKTRQPYFPNRTQVLP